MPKLSEVLGEELAKQVQEKIGENLEIVLKETTDKSPDFDGMTDSEYIKYRERQKKEGK